LKCGRKAIPLEFDPILRSQVFRTGPKYCDVCEWRFVQGLTDQAMTVEAAKRFGMKREASRATGAGAVFSDD
jgi:hypothetical protein